MASAVCVIRFSFDLQEVIVKFRFKVVLISSSRIMDARAREYPRG